MAHPDDHYIPAPGHDGEIPDDLHTAHVRHDIEVWTDSDQHVCLADSLQMARKIARCLRLQASQETKEKDE